MIGVFVVGCFVTAIVIAACSLIVTGIRADKRQLDGYDDAAPENVRI